MVKEVLKEEGKTKMGKNKQRTAVNRKVNKLLSEFGNKCEWWDDGYPECMLPWSNKNETAVMEIRLFVKNFIINI